MTYNQAVRWRTLGAVRLLILRLGRWLAAGDVIILGSWLRLDKRVSPVCGDHDKLTLS